MRRSSFVLTLIAVAVAACGAPQAPPKPAPAPPPPAPAPPAQPAAPPAAPPPLTGPVTLEDVHEGQQVHAWTPTAVYVDDDRRAIGGRFVHVATGFTLDYLRIASAPQGFLWVTSFPTSDKGEPHTQEHLLLGKGDRGRKFGSFESMALSESSAFTDQWHTAYHFHTVAGHDVFWPVFDNQLGAMLYPDYTDEEIRREVRNFGVDKDATGKLHLEEKGTVYNEMVRYYEDPDAALWRAAGRMQYGEHHPIVFESGGYPEAIRTMTPQDIRAFHDGAYRLSTMGMVGAFPPDMALGDVLDHTAEILDKEAALAPATRGPVAAITKESQLPKPEAAPAGQIRIVDYPYSSNTNPGPLMLAWPATRALDPTERELLSLFIDQLAGDESTLLYKKLIDGKTRTLDTGASSVWGNVSYEQGQPVRIGLSGVKSDKLDEKTVEAVRALVLAELARIAQLPDGDPELAEIAKHIDNRIVDKRRQLIKFLDTPPGFGTRGIGPTWMDFLNHLERTPGFTKSLTLSPTLTEVSAIVNGKENPWRSRLRAWGLLETPYGVAAKPSSDLRAKIDAERVQRNTAELARLQQQYKTADADSTLAAYAKDYDAQSATIEAAAKATVLPPLVDHPPMTLDDDLAYTTDAIAGLPALRATFPTMASARVTLAFRLDAVPEADLFYLALLPTLLSDSGVIDDGKPVTAAEVRERQRTEILDLDVGYEHMGIEDLRPELVVAGAGINATETKAALGWMARAMFAPDWREANLPRLRDLVDQAITANHHRMLDAEENWVANPRDAWSHQDQPVRLHSVSFLTRAHDLHRLRWMLEDPLDKQAKAEAAKLLDTLGGASERTRDQLTELAARLAGDPKAPTGKPGGLALYLGTGASPKAAAILRDAGKDFAALLPELPDGTLGADWRYLCAEMAHDLRAGAPAALAGLARTRAAVLAAGNARVVEVGAAAHLDTVAADVAAVIAKLDHGTVKRASYAGARAIEARLREHDKQVAKGAPELVGLVDPATSSGVFENTAPAPGFGATSESEILDFLASTMYSGHGAHSMFMKTWAAGLAYSNGLHPEPENHRLEYYAERCPLLPQTLKFVIEQLREQKTDANIARYAVAKSFRSRIAAPYEERAEDLAAELASGLTPDKVKAFRSQVVALAGKADLADALYARMPAVYGKVLPGYGALDKAATYFVIGPDKQLTAYQEYLHAAVGKTTKLHRLYPRDFWIPEKL